MISLSFFEPFSLVVLRNSYCAVVTGLRLRISVTITHNVAKQGFTQKHEVIFHSMGCTRDAVNGTMSPICLVAGGIIFTEFGVHNEK